MFGFFHIPVKLISRQVHTWSLIHKPFWYLDGISNERVAQIDNPFWSQLWSESLLYKEDCHSINKPLGTYSFLDYGKVMTGFSYGLSAQKQSPSSDHSNELASWDHQILFKVT